MPALATRHKTRAALTILVIMYAATVCRAQDCGSTAYAYEDRVVFFTCGKTGTPEYDVILLDDATALRISGRIPISTSRAFDAAAFYKNQWIVLTWDRLEIYDLDAPAHPVLVAKFQMKDQTPAPGFARVERAENNKFLVLSTVSAAVLTVEGDIPKWTLNEITQTADHREKMLQPPPEWRFIQESESPVVIRETPQFRYELIWRGQAKPGEYYHRQYLRKVNTASQRTVSELKLVEHLETID